MGYKYSIEEKNIFFTSWTPAVSYDSFLKILYFFTLCSTSLFLDLFNLLYFSSAPYMETLLLLLYTILFAILINDQWRAWMICLSVLSVFIPWLLFYFKTRSSFPILVFYWKHIYILGKNMTGVGNVWIIICQLNIWSKVGK